MPDLDTDTIRNNALLTRYGFRPTILGLPDERQPCCVQDCGTTAERTLFLEVVTHDEYDGQAMRLFLCAAHADEIEASTRPKPVGAQYFFPKLHLDSIPKEARELGRQYIERTINLHIEESGLRRLGDTEWAWQYGRVPAASGGFVEGTMLTGNVRVERGDGG